MSKKNIPIYYIGSLPLELMTVILEYIYFEYYTNGGYETNIVYMRKFARLCILNKFYFNNLSIMILPFRYRLYKKYNKKYKNDNEVLTYEQYVQFGVIFYNHIFENYVLYSDNKYLMLI